MAFILPSLPYFPILGPTTNAAARAIQPPTEWTAVDPAKSINPKFSIHPLVFPNKPPQTQCPDIG